MVGKNKKISGVKYVGRVVTGLADLVTNAETKETYSLMYHLTIFEGDASEERDCRVEIRIALENLKDLTYVGEVNVCLRDSTDEELFQALLTLDLVDSESLDRALENMMYWRDVSIVHTEFRNGSMVREVIQEKDGINNNTKSVYIGNNSDKDRKIN